MALEQRYSDPVINRQYWLADAMIRVKPTAWNIIDQVAANLSDDEVETFCRIVAALNSRESGEQVLTA